MEQIAHKIRNAPYVKKDPDFERRKNRFFGSPQETKESRKFLSVMKKIGFFQLEENNLDHIRGVKDSREKSLTVREFRAEKKKLIL